jgi:hypothetical protein
MAVSNRGEVTGTIIHSDQGVQGWIQVVVAAP